MEARERHGFAAPLVMGCGKPLGLTPVEGKALLRIRSRSGARFARHGLVLLRSSGTWRLASGTASPRRR